VGCNGRQLIQKTPVFDQLRAFFGIRSFSNSIFLPDNLFALSTQSSPSLSIFFPSILKFSTHTLLVNMHINHMVYVHRSDFIKYLEITNLIFSLSPRPLAYKKLSGEIQKKERKI
jgi:hypothetical protein